MTRRSARPHTERPRVLVVPSSYFVGNRTVGGGERYAHEYARALARITDTSLALFGAETGASVVDGLEIRTFGMREVGERWFSPFTGEARRALAEYDVVHLMVFPTPVTDYLMLRCWWDRQTLVLTDVGGGAPSPTTYLQRIHPRLGLSRLADGLALLSEHSSRQFEDWGQPRVLLYGGAAPSANTSEHADAADASDEDPYALFVGRLLPHKGVLELIESLDAGILLRIVGRPYDPSYFARLQAAAVGRRVEFHTSADDVELDRLYRGARLVLQPSIPVREGKQDTSELLGLVTLEGMAAGKPVVVTRTGSLPELVSEGVTGFVVEPGDRVALSERVSRLMSDGDLARTMGAAARTHVDQRFTWDRVARRGLEFYSSLRQRAGRQRP